MSKESNEIKIINLYGTKEGVISVAHLDKPYETSNEGVVSIGVSLSGNINAPEWKVHIPYENIDEVIEALKLAKIEFGKQ